MSSEMVRGADEAREVREAASGSVIAQTVAAVRKNVMQKRRTPISCCMETFLPVIFVLGMVGIWAAVGGTQDKSPDKYLHYNDEYKDVDTFLAKRVCINRDTSYLDGIMTCKELAAAANISKFDTEERDQLKPMNNRQVDNSKDAEQAQKTIEEASSRRQKDGGIPKLSCVGTKHNIPVDDLCFLPGTEGEGFNMLSNFSNARLIPSLDSLILLRWLWRTSLEDERVEYVKGLKGFVTHGEQIHFAPDNAYTRSLANYFNSTSKFFKYLYYDKTATTADGNTAKYNTYGGNQYLSSPSFFETEDAADDYAVDPDYIGRTWFTVVVDEATTSKLDASLRFNRSSTVWTSKEFIHMENYQGGQFRNDQLAFLQHLSGFDTSLNMLHKWYSTEVLNFTQPAEEPAMATFANPEWTDYIFLAVGSGQGYFELFMVLAYLYPVSQFTKSLVTEKELRVREAMMIMGLGHGSFYVSWFLTYMFEVVLSSLVNMLITKATFYPRSDAGIIFFLFFFYGLSCVCLSFLISTVFSKSRAAALVSPLLFFVLSVPMFLIANATPGVKGIISLLSPSAMSIGMTNMANHEMSGGMGAKQMVSEADDINMLGILFILAIDCILYALIALYLDAVFPSEWGTRKHPMFCILDPIAWIKRKSAGAQPDGEIRDSRDAKGVYEDDSANPNPIVVQLKGLKKQFTRGDETFTAVNDLCMHMRENEITVLLGHNGAGKTTTMNMMTGMLDITEGDCEIYGHSVRHELSKVRKEISLCPQHNILWPEISCAEHLRFYAAIKGLSGEKREAEVDRMLKEVDLFEKKEDMAGALSGGQKRKLSVAIAFIGDSKLVFLDEPTAGMDVAARRFTWDLIKRESKGRAVLLTTHFMDEADLLGHTISIMSKGMLKCSGSPMFLKSRLGVGYSITLAIDPQKEGATEPARNLITSHIPDAVPMSTGAAEVAYRLPMESSTQFPELLGELEVNGQSLGVNGFGITVTTLEEIFLKIAEDEHLEADKANEANSPVNDSHEVQPKANKKHIWTQDEQERDESTDGKSRIKLDYAMQFKALLVKRFHNSTRDRRTQCLQILLPVICILLSFLLTLVEFWQNAPKMYLEPEMYAPHAMSKFTLPTDNCDFDNSLWPEKITHDASLNATNAVAFDDLVRENWDTHEDEFRTVAMYCNETLLSQTYLNASNPTSVLLFNTSGWFATSEAIHYYYRMYAKSKVSGTKPEIKVAAHNLPWTDREQALIENVKTFMIGMIIMIPFTLIPSTFVSWIVKEKECKAKHLQFASGMNYWVYWLSNLFFDMVSFLFTEFLVIIIFLIFSRDEYVGGGQEFGATFLLIFFFGLAGISTSYAWGFFFKEHPTAQNVVMLGNFICGFVLVILVFMLKIFESTKSEADTLTWICRIIPSFCLGEGVINLAALGFAKAFGIEKSPLDMDVTGWPIVYMAIEFPIFFLIALFLDHPNRMKRQQQLFHQPDVIPPAIDDEDPDVARERRRIEEPDTVPYGNASPDNAEAPTPSNVDHNAAKDLVVVKHLCKIYDNGKKAVKNLSFGVKKGEVFGFLGTNGAGKTTTISILCGEQMPTHGRAYVDEFDVVDEALDAQRHIGYCPQFDALLDLLTPQEHLQLYAGLRGIPADQQESVIDTLMSVCELYPHKDTVAMNLSGGNKRKLSVALSLVGGPLVVFLDEPSAGMDPMARRGLWEVINDISSHCSVVLTTHHLEEVEALAHRVAIMVDGQMMCIGDKTHLKKKFGSGFEMQIRVDAEEHVDALADYVTEHLPDAILSEYRSLKFHYELPPDTKLSSVFRELEEMKAKLGITDYAVQQTSIESVFLRISAAAEAAEEEEKHAETSEKGSALGPKTPLSAKTKTPGTAHIHSTSLEETETNVVKVSSSWNKRQPRAEQEQQHQQEQQQQDSQSEYSAAA